MKTLILTLILVFFATLAHADFAEDLQNGNKFYAEKNYEKAKTEYEKVLLSGYESAALYYNLGNVYYRTKSVANAVYYYEKAALLAPGDEDIQVNLAFARNRIYDKITPNNKPALLRYYETLVRQFTSGNYAAISLLTFVFSLLAVALYLFSKSKKRKIIGFSAGIVFFIFAAISFVFSQKRYTEQTKLDTAIVFAESVSVKSAPDNSATELFIIHEGLKVGISEQQGNWTEIRLEDGRAGWLTATSLKVL